MTSVMQQNTSSCYRSKANNFTSLIPTYNWSYVEQHAYWIRCSYVYSKTWTRNPGLRFLKPGFGKVLQVFKPYWLSIGAEFNDLEWPRTPK